MGNNQGQQSDKTRGNVYVSPDPHEAQQQRLRRGYQIWAERIDSACISREHFQNVLFTHHLEYGGLLFDYMVGGTEEGDTSRTGLNVDRYTESGLAVLYPPNNSQLHSYFSVFSARSKCISKKDVETMLDSCHRLVVQCAGLPFLNNQSTPREMKAVIDSLFGQCEEISESDFVYWCGRHCRQIFDGVHQITSAVLLGDDSVCKQVAGAEAEPESEFVQQVAAGTGPLNSTSLWLLTSSLPASFFPSADGIGKASDSLILPMLQVCTAAGWHLLYDSNEQGLSVNRFQHHVFEYKGATLMFVTFNGHVYCIAADTEWREGRQKFGGSDSCLIQIHPKYTVMQSGPEMLYINFSDRTVPRGLQVGKDARSMFLSIDEGLSKVTHYGIPVDLHRIQVWGCAGLLTKEAQQKQKDWEKRQAQKSKDRKIKLEDWENNPDRQLLEMGGVRTEHAER